MSDMWKHQVRRETHTEEKHGSKFCTSKRSTTFAALTSWRSTSRRSTALRRNAVRLRAVVFRLVLIGAHRGDTRRARNYKASYIQKKWIFLPGRGHHDLEGCLCTMPIGRKIASSEGPLPCLWVTRARFLIHNREVGKRTHYWWESKITIGLTFKMIFIKKSTKP